LEILVGNAQRLPVPGATPRTGYNSNN
jgi:hypothetical protein